MKHSSPLLSTRFVALALLSGLSLPILGCGGHHGHHGGNHSIQVFDEREPNDDPLFGDFIGYVHQDTHLIVEGYVDDDPSPYGDIYDHFEFVTDEPASFEVRLESFSIWNDVALGVFDPVTEEMILWVEDPSGVHWADFTVHATDTPFVLVVAATYGAGSYEIELLGRTYNPLLAAQGGNQPEARDTIELTDPTMDLRKMSAEAKEDAFPTMP